MGEKLIRAAMNFARGEGAVVVQLETAVDNLRAQRFYATIGFVKQEADANYLHYHIQL